MKLEDLIKQCTEDSERWFPGFSRNLPMTWLCLVGEVGEAANMLKKAERGTHIMDEDYRQRLAEEVVDVLIYLCNAMGHPLFEGIDWSKKYDEKQEKNEKRFGNKSPKRLPYEVLAEAGLAPERRQNWQQKGDFAS